MKPGRSDRSLWKSFRRLLPPKMRHGVDQGIERLTEELGGPARRRAVLLLGSALGLSGADSAAVGAVAPRLEPVLRIGPTGLGLLVSITSLVGALATVPVGSLTDRLKRVRLLWVSIVIWGVAEAASGLAFSYTSLLVIRIALGAVTATAGPTVASLTGDLFPAKERARMYGFIVTGEFVGAGAGLLFAGLLTSWFGWRVAFGALAVPSAVLAFALRRYLPEPARGGRSPIAKGDERILSAAEASRRSARRARHLPRHEQRTRSGPASGLDGAGPVPVATTTVGPLPPAEPGGRRRGGSYKGAVLDRSARDLTLPRAIAYVLRVRTNVMLIVGSSLGYFFLAGLRTFALVFVRGRFGLSQGEATLLILVGGASAVAGIVAAGSATDRSGARKRPNARVVVGAVGYFAAAVLLIPVFLTEDIWIAIPFLMLGAAALAAPNPVLDAAGLDVVPPHVWGRGEGVRTSLRNTLEAFAPLMFGALAGAFGAGKAGFGSAASGSSTDVAAATAAQAHGLDMAFLLMLVPLAAAGAVTLLSRRYYPTDVAAAAESERHLQGSQ